jgi:hypothetical protein
MPFETIRNPAVVYNERFDEANNCDLALRADLLWRSPSARRRKSIMSKRNRDYRKEYARRVARGAQQGLSRAASRGHPRAGERQKASVAQSIDPNSREELAVKSMRRGSSLRAAAAQYRVAQERLREYLKGNTEASRKNGKWVIADRRVRVFPFYSDGRVVTAQMSLEETSFAGRYMQAVKQFLRSGDSQFLKPFAGKGVRDTKGKFYPFEFEENILYELDHRDEAVIPEQYRISERIAS